MQIAQRERFAAADSGSRGSDEHTVHRHAIARGQIARRKLMFRGDVGNEAIGFAAERYLIALPQFGEGDQHVVARVELEELLQVSGGAAQNGAPCESRPLL